MADQVEGSEDSVRGDAQVNAERLQSFLANAPVALFALDRAGTFTLAEGRALEALGLQPHELFGRSVYEFHGDQPAILQCVDRALAGEPGTATVEIRGVVWDARYAPVHDKGGDVSGVIGVITDVTDRMRAEEALRHQALHDALTDLPNRTLLHDRLEQALALVARQHGSLALLLLDLDRFKEVNDTFGHHCGDMMLQQVGQRLRQVTRAADTVARLGGDEFALILPGDGQMQAIFTGDRISAALEAPFVVDSHTIHIGSSVGIALYPAHGGNSATLLRHADTAMYLAKHAHRGAVVYSAEQDRHSPRLALVDELRDAILQGALPVHYQPIVDVRTRHVLSVEALVCWPHPTYGPLPPNQFILLAESTGLMAQLTDWVLETALHQHQTWQQAGMALDVSVNLSMSSLHDPGLSSSIAALLRRYAVSPSSLQLEVTESALMMDTTGTVEQLLTRLAGLGVHLAVDDFGTGYSSLVQLNRLPLNTLKIDKSFVLNMVDDERANAIVTSTIGLGHGLGMQVVVEGVETRATWERLRDSGCDAAQGTFLGCPLPAEDLAHWLVDAHSVHVPFTASTSGPLC